MDCNAVSPDTARRTGITKGFTALGAAMTLAATRAGAGEKQDTARLDAFFAPRT